MGSCASKSHHKSAAANESKFTSSKDKSIPETIKQPPVTIRRFSKQKVPLVDSRSFLDEFKEAENAQILDVPKNSKEVELIRGSLAKHFIFRNLNDHYISIIINQMKLYNLKSTELIFEQGNPGSNFYVVSKGKVEVVITDKRVKILSSGESFGEMALLHNTPRTASVITITDTSL